ncbi:hypothetical protein RAC90_19345 [Pantoea sp. CS_6]|nr:hypothetical protein [Pantoea ananatis]
MSSPLSEEVSGADPFPLFSNNLFTIFFVGRCQQGQLFGPALLETVR